MDTTTTSWERVHKAGILMHRQAVCGTSIRLTAWLRRHDPREELRSGALWEVYDFDRHRQVAGGEAPTLGDAKNACIAVLAHVYGRLSDG